MSKHDNSTQHTKLEVGAIVDDKAIRHTKFKKDPANKDLIRESHSPTGSIRAWRQNTSEQDFVITYNIQDLRSGCERIKNSQLSDPQLPRYVHEQRQQLNGVKRQIELERGEELKLEQGFDGALKKSSKKKGSHKRDGSEAERRISQQRYKEITELISSNLEILDKIDSFIKSYNEATSTAKQLIEKQFDKFKQTISESFNKLVQGLSDWFEAVGKKVSEAIKGRSEKTSDARTFTSLLSSIGKGNQGTDPKSDSDEQNNSLSNNAYWREQQQRGKNDGSESVIQALKLAFNIHQSHADESRRDEEHPSTLIASEKEKELLLKGIPVQRGFKNINSLEHEIADKKRESEEEYKNGKKLSRV